MMKTTTIKTYTLDGLLDRAGADGEARAAFARQPLMLFHGGWQSWSPGWELAPGETLPQKVRFLPDLYALTAAPWEVNRKSYGSKKGSAGDRAVSGSFIMYLRAGDWYLVLAAKADAGAPVVYTVSPGRQQVSIGVYGGADGGAEDRACNLLCVKGFFALKDALAAIYRQDFSALDFLGARPGGYASWYNHYTRINEKIIFHDLEGITRRENLIKLMYLDRNKPAVFQIDDGWQKAVGDWEPCAERFPRGLETLAAAIEDAGMIPGLWLAPFLVTKKARIFREKPEWLLRNGAGRPVRAGWNPNWDGTYYCLDISRDGVLAYLGGLMDRVIDGWGFRYVKLDFLYAGFLGADAAAYEKACRVLAAKKCRGGGKPAAYLGCGLPLGASFRHFPLSRTGTDTRESWDWKAAKFLGHLGRPSALLNLRDTLGRSFMNGTVYKNDPDVVFLRSKNCALTENEKELIALVNFLLADQIMLSDDVTVLDESDLALTRRIAALYDELSGDEYGAVMLQRDVYRLESRSGRVGGIINLSDKPFAPPPETGAPLTARRLSDGSLAPHSILIFKKEDSGRTRLPVLGDAETD
jgi:alpha-galactosidase